MKSSAPAGSADTSANETHCSIVSAVSQGHRIVRHRSDRKGPVREWAVVAQEKNPPALSRRIVPEQTPYVDPSSEWNV